MRAQNDAGQRLSALQRVTALFCILVLFTFVGIVLFLTPKVYAHAAVLNYVKGKPLPTATIPTTVPTAIPTTIPTIVPTIIPTAIPTTVPTAIPTAKPTIQPTVPRPTPTVVIKPTSTSAAGVQPPGGSTQQPTPTLTPSPSRMTATPSSSGLPPAITDVVPSPTANTYSSVITAQDNGKLILPTVPEIALGSSILGAGALLAWFLWRRKHGELLPANGYSASQGEMAHSSASSGMPYAQATLAVGNIGGMLRESRSSYREDAIQQGMVYSTEPMFPQQADASSLETIMRQAHEGLFALPDKEEYS